MLTIHRVPSKAQVHMLPPSVVLLPAAPHTPSGIVQVAAACCGAGSLLGCLLMVTCCERHTSTAAATHRASVALNTKPAGSDRKVTPPATAASASVERLPVMHTPHLLMHVPLLLAYCVRPSHLMQSGYCNMLQ